MSACRVRRVSTVLLTAGLLAIILGVFGFPLRGAYLILGMDQTSWNLLLAGSGAVVLLVGMVLRAAAVKMSAPGEGKGGTIWIILAITTYLVAPLVLFFTWVFMGTTTYTQVPLPSGVTVVIIERGGPDCSTHVAVLEGIELHSRGLLSYDRCSGFDNAGRVVEDESGAVTVSVGGVSLSFDSR